jgi:argonaute-like protein implicated in RNA metabolism and viral defense
MKKWSGIGTPKPLEINLEINNTQYSISEIAKQILALTKLDWNTTEVSVKLPITLKYSNKAANLAPYLRSDEGEGLPEITDLRFLI